MDVPNFAVETAWDVDFPTFNADGLLVKWNAVKKKYDAWLPVGSILTGVSGVVLQNGTAPLTANWSAGGFQIGNVAAPTHTADASTKAYTDRGGGMQAYTPVGGVVTVDLSVSTRNVVTLNAAAVTIAVTNYAAGMIFSIKLTQDGTGSRLVNWFGGVSWAGGSAPTLTTTAAKSDSMVFECTAATPAFDGFIVGQNI